MLFSRKWRNKTRLLSIISLLFFTSWSVFASWTCIDNWVEVDLPIPCGTCDFWSSAYLWALTSALIICENSNVNICDFQDVDYIRDDSWAVPLWKPIYYDDYPFSCTEQSSGWWFDFISANAAPLLVSSSNGTCSCEPPISCDNIPGSLVWDTCATFDWWAIDMPYVEDPNTPGDCLCLCPNQVITDHPAHYDINTEFALNWNDITCFGDDDGSLTLVETSAFDLGDFSYQRSHWPTTSSVTWLEPNIVWSWYILTIHPIGYNDATCDFTEFSQIEEPTELELTWSSNNPNCAWVGGSIVLSASWWTQPYSFTVGTITNSTWVFWNLWPGTYTATLDDWNSCAATSLEFTLTSVVCDDSNLCTENVCDNWVCDYSDPVVCDDNNECTTGSCDPTNWCEFTDLDDWSSCFNDGNICTDDICQSWVCDHVPDETNDPSCCDSASVCCPWDTYPWNTNCICDSAITCCDGDVYPANQNCICDQSTTCCPWDTYLNNTNCVCDPALECCNGETNPPNTNCSITCNPTIECCDGNSYPWNPNCPEICDSSVECCNGDTYPWNTNCICDSAITCCDGDTYPWNTNCICDSSITCCDGDSYPWNTNCICDATILCCPWDTYLNNTNCICDSSIECCVGDTYPGNSHCAEIEGCTDPNATNFDPAANVNVGCEYPDCVTDADCPDGTDTECEDKKCINEICSYPALDPLPGTCDEIEGCIDPLALNFNPSATYQDTSICEYPQTSCADIFTLTPLTWWINEEFTVTLAISWTLLVWGDWWTIINPLAWSYTQQYSTWSWWEYTVTFSYEGEGDEGDTLECEEEFEVSEESEPWECPSPQTIYDEDFDLEDNPAMASCLQWLVEEDWSGDPIISFDPGSNTREWNCLWINDNEVVDTCQLTKIRCWDWEVQKAWQDWEEDTPDDEECEQDKDPNCLDNCKYPEYECIVDEDDPEAYNNDPDNFGPDVIYCKDSWSDPEDQNPDELWEGDRYWDRVNEWECNTENHCQRYLPWVCGILNETDQALFSKRNYPEWQPWCRFDENIDAPQPWPRAWNFEILASTVFPLITTWECPVNPWGTYADAELEECSLEIFPTPLCNDLNLVFKDNGVDTEWLVPVGTAVDISFDASWNSLWAVDWNAAVIQNWITNDDATLVTYDEEGVYVIKIEMTAMIWWSEITMTCPKPLIVWDPDLTDGIELWEDEDPEDPCGPAAGTTISYTEQAIQLVFAWWLEWFCDDEFANPVVTYDQENSEYAWTCPGMQRWDYCTIQVLQEPVECWDAWVNYGWINDTDMTIDLWSTFTVNRWNFAEPGLIIEDVALIDDAWSTIEWPDSNWNWNFYEAIYYDSDKTNWDDGYNIWDEITFVRTVSDLKWSTAECEQVITVVWQPEECGDNARVYTIDETWYEWTDSEDYCDNGLDPDIFAPFPDPWTIVTWNCWAVECEAEQETEDTVCGWIAENWVVSNFFNGRETSTFKPAYCDEPSTWYDDMEMNVFQKTPTGWSWECENTLTQEIVSCEVKQIISASCWVPAIVYSPWEFIWGTTEQIQVIMPWDITVDEIIYPGWGWSSWLIPDILEVITDYIKVSISNDTWWSETCSYPIRVYPTIFVEPVPTQWGWWGDWWQSWGGRSSWDTWGWISWRVWSTDAWTTQWLAGLVNWPASWNLAWLVQSPPSSWDQLVTIITVPNTEKWREEPKECYSDDWMECPNTDTSSASFDLSSRPPERVNAFEYLQSTSCSYNWWWNENQDFQENEDITNQAYLKLLARRWWLVEGQVLGPQQHEAHADWLLAWWIIDQSTYDSFVRNPYWIVDEVSAINLIASLRDFKWVEQDVIDEKLDQLEALSNRWAFTRMESVALGAVAMKVMEEHATQNQCLSELLAPHFFYQVPQ